MIERIKGVQTKRLLFITTDIPWPLDCGYKIRVFENLLALSKFYEVTVVSMTESMDYQDKLAILSGHLPHIRFTEPVFHRIHIRHSPYLLGKVILSSLLSGIPYKGAKFLSRPLESLTKELIENRDFNVIYLEMATFSIAQFLKKRKNGDTRLVGEAHNVESSLMKEFGQNQRLGLIKLAAYVEFFRTRSYEKKVYSQCDLVITISDEDRREIANIIGDSSKVVAVPPCVGELPEFHLTRGDKMITFIGLMSWPPNVEGIRWFADQVLPLLRLKRPESKVQVIGGGMPAALGNYLESEGIQVLGYVDDLSRVYRNTAVFIAPFLTGGGVRLKILDAMKASVPIVSTRVGCKGLNLTSGKQVLIADTPRDFADAIHQLLEHEALSHQLASNSLTYLKENHSREAVARAMKQAFDKSKALLLKTQPLAAIGHSILEGEDR